MTKIRVPLIVLALLAVMSLAFVACSDDDDGGDEDTTPQATSSDTTPSGTSTGDGDTTGVTDTEIKLGTHTSLTGPIAAYNIIPNFTKAYFDHINATEGGVNGRSINYLREDDQYNPAQAVDLTRKLVEQDGIFAMFNALGTPNHLQVIDYLQDNEVPDMFVATGAIEWVRSPADRPLVFGSNPNYTGEGLAIGKWILDNMGEDVTVGVLYQNDDFGQDGLAGVKLALPDQVVSEQPYEVTDPEVNSRIDQMRAQDVEVVVIFATPNHVGAAIKHAKADLGWSPQFAISAVSMNELTALIAGAENIEGAIGPVATYMSYHTSVPAVQAHLDLVANSGIQGANASVLTLYAQYVAEMMVETLNRAGEDLTRESLIEAAESLSEWTCSVCLFPTALSPDDHDPSQAIAIGDYQGGRVVISETAYSWEGVSVDELGLDTLQSIEVPAEALTPPQ